MFSIVTLALGTVRPLESVMMPLRVAVVYWARSMLGINEIRKSKVSLDDRLFNEFITAPEKTSSQSQCGFAGNIHPKMAALSVRNPHEGCSSSGNLRPLSAEKEAESHSLKKR